MTIKTITKNIYVACDGLEFDNKEACEKHELNLRQKEANETKRAIGVTKYLKSYCMKHHTANEIDGKCINTNCPFHLGDNYFHCKFVTEPRDWNFIE